MIPIVFSMYTCSNPLKLGRQQLWTFGKVENSRVWNITCFVNFKINIGNLKIVVGWRGGSHVGHELMMIHM